MTEDQPLVTVNILSYNRRNELRNTLTKVFEQDYKNIEVIVIDNASTDGSSKMVTEEFPEVKLIKMGKNIGIAGWNEGFRVAKGEYILVLDDDSYPEAGAIHKAMESITKENKFGVVCFKVFNKAEERFESDHIDKLIPNTFIGCGALVRKNILGETGLFSDLLFLYEHETEFSMRVYNSGYTIKFCNEALVYHVGSLSNRTIMNHSDRRRKYFLCRNYGLILLLHFSFFRVLIFLPQLVLSRLFISIIERNLFTTLKGFLSSILIIPKIIRSRLPLNNETQKFYKYGNYMGRFVRDKRY